MTDAELKLQLANRQLDGDAWDMNSETKCDDLAQAVIDLTSEVTALRAALSEVCDLFYTQPEQLAAGFDPHARIAELRKLVTP